MIIKTILIDDEAHALESLERDLLRHCPYVEILASCESPGEGLLAIKEFKPDLVFMDIQMPGMNGFQLLESLDNPSFDLIITTAFRQHAADAFKAEAVDFLEKPYDAESLRKAVRKVWEKRSNLSLEAYLEKLNPQESPKKYLRIRSLGGFEWLIIDDILYCEADGGSTEFVRENGKKVHSSRNLGHYEKILSPYNFCRIHARFLINPRHLTQFNSKERTVKMRNGTRLSVSNAKSSEFIQQMADLSID